MGPQHPQRQFTSAAKSTLWYTCVDYIFALQSSYEHRRLCADQLQLHEPNDKPAFIVYHETVSKTNSGGLAHCKLKPKQVEHFANKCFVFMYKKYQSLCPADSPADAFSTLDLSGGQGQIADIPDNQSATTH